MKNRILFSASFFHALNDGVSVLVPMAFPLLYSHTDLITSYSQIGLLSNLGLLTTLFVQFLVVKLSYQVEYRVLMLASFLGISLFVVSITFSFSFLSLLFFFLLIRIFMSFYHPILIAWISKSQSAKGLDFAMGIQSGSGNAGVFLAFVSAGFLAERWNWKTPLLAWAVVALILGTVGYAALRGVSSKADVRPSLRFSSWLRVLKKIRYLAPGFVFGGLGWVVAVYFAPSLLHHEFSIPMGRAGLYLAFWIGLGTFSGYGYGFLSRALGRKCVFLLCLGGASISLALIGLAPERKWAILGLLMFGLFLFMSYPSLHTFVGSIVPRVEQTQAFSWVANMQMVAGAVIALAAGILSDRFGIRTPFLLSSLFAAICFVYYAFSRKPSVEKPSPA